MSPCWNAGRAAASHPSTLQVASSSHWTSWHLGQHTWYSTLTCRRQQWPWRDPSYHWVHNSMEQVDNLVYICKAGGFISLWICGFHFYGGIPLARCFLLMVNIGKPIYKWMILGKIIHFNRLYHCRPSILGYLHDSGNSHDFLQVTNVGWLEDLVTPLPSSSPRPTTSSRSANRTNPGVCCMGLKNSSNHRYIW